MGEWKCIAGGTVASKVDEDCKVAVEEDYKVPCHVYLYERSRNHILEEQWTRC